MGEGLEGRTHVLSDDKFKALNKALKIDKKKPHGKELFSAQDSLTRLFCSVTTTFQSISAMRQLVFVEKTTNWWQGRENCAKNRVFLFILSSKRDFMKKKTTIGNKVL